MQPVPGTVVLADGPSIFPGGGPPGTVDTITFRIQNLGSNSFTLPAVFVAIRDTGGSNIDAPCTNGVNVALAPQQSFTCNVVKTFPAVGTYTWFPAYQGTDGGYHGLANNGTVTIVPAAPGVVTLTSGPSIFPGGGPPGTVDTFTYAITNTGGSPLNLPAVFVAIRTPGGANMDAPCSGGVNVNLAAGATFTCTATARFPAVGTYTWWADYQSADSVYHQISTTGTVGIVP